MSRTEWELISEQRNAQEAPETLRLKVPGGWLYLIRTGAGIVVFVAEPQALHGVLGEA